MALLPPLPGLPEEEAGEAEMTIPRERTMAVQNAEVFLMKLSDPKLTPKIPLSIRRQARWLLKHYPGVYDLEEACRAKPDIWGPPIWRGAWDRYMELRKLHGVGEKTLKKKRGKRG